LLWQESFAKPLTDERWGRSYGDLHIHVKPCGLLEWTAPPYNTIWAWLTEEAASGLPSDALVELRLLPKPRGNWAVALAVNVVTTSSSVSGSVTQGRICTLEHDLAGKAGYFRLSGRVYHDAGYDYEYSEYTPLAGNLVLQSWIEGNKHFCRVVPEGGKPLQVEHEFDGGFPEQGTIRLTVVNQATNAPYVWLWMDWLRVFAR
jgi:hypothetical protein